MTWDMTAAGRLVPALKPGDLVAFTLPDPFRPGPVERRTGEVIQVCADGLVTVSVPQHGPPMQVTAPANKFAWINTEATP